MLIMLICGSKLLNLAVWTTESVDIQIVSDRDEYLPNGDIAIYYTVKNNGIAVKNCSMVIAIIDTSNHIYVIEDFSYFGEIASGQEIEALDPIIISQTNEAKLGLSRSDDNPTVLKAWPR